MINCVGINIYIYEESVNLGIIYACVKYDKERKITFITNYGQNVSHS